MICMSFLAAAPAAALLRITLFFALAARELFFASRWKEMTFSRRPGQNGRLSPC
jgi:hypothetical protein